MKKNKVVNLFGDKNNDVKYSTLLEELLTPFAKYFEDDNEFEYQEDIFEFAISAWNFGNMFFVSGESEFEGMMDLAKEDDDKYPLLRKLIDSKIINFKEFTNFIVDFEVHEKNGVLTLTVVTQTEDDYLGKLLKDTYSLENSKDEFDENYINRSAISLKPLQPFIDWHNNIYPTTKIDASDLNDINFYLINNSNYEDIESYLKKKFDKYFMMELDGWHTNKKEWPQRRNYKMFKEWFRIDISTAVYDLEKTPVSKTE